MKPIIGITANYVDDDRMGIGSHIGAKHQDWMALAADYVRSVRRAGGVPVILPIVEEGDHLCAYIEAVDGVIFSGGSDIDPSCYGEWPSPRLGRVIPARDRFEIALARKLIYETDIPVLGICRGLQLINVALGGSLYQDLGTQFPNAMAHGGSNFPKWEAMHRVTIVSGTETARVLGVSEMGVNSLHHQAIKETAPSLRVTMKSADGVIEGVEGTERADLIAVQWHPEMMTDRHEEHLLLFRDLVRRAQERRQRRR